MSNTSAHRQALTNHGNACHDRANTIDSQHRAFQAEVSALSSTWKGAGASANMALLPVLDDLHRAVTAGFRLCGDKVHSARAGYDAGDAHQEETISKVTSQASGITTSLT